jgi:hypothetical protein
MDFHAHASQLMVTNAGLITLRPMLASAWCHRAALPGSKAECRIASAAAVLPAATSYSWQRGGASHGRPLSCAGGIAISERATGARAGLPQRYRLDDGDGRLMQVLIDDPGGTARAPADAA